VLGGAVIGVGGLVAGEVVAAVAGAVATSGAAAAAVVQQARSIRRALPSDTFEQLAWAVADGLLGCAATTAGADRVRVAVQPDGYYRALLEGVTELESRLFAESLDELLGPLAAPRYLVGRVVVRPPATRVGAMALAVRRVLHLPVEAAVAYHAVPSYLAVNAGRVEVFAAAWRRHVAPTTPVYAGSPEGAAILDLHRGADPFAVTSQIRTLWR